MPLMLHAFREGGWAMWLILAIGLGTLALSIRSLTTPQPADRNLIAAAVATFMAGVVGTVSGLIATMHYIQAGRGDGESPLMLVIYGTGESLNNLALAGTLVTLAAVIRAFRLRS